ncbi:hypothetical protein [Paraburkholderia youngii]|uniref:hypothetical protein n=1 Tax=Paraburkholderia youngii TaxID=2782701 RepID=UPI003D24D421
MNPRDRIPVLHIGFRSLTNPETGLVSVEEALKAGNPGSASDLRLGNEYPLYEVALDRDVYRMIIRPRRSDGRYEVIRCVANGLKTDGFVFEPQPINIPNTPSALIREMADVTGISPADLISRAHSVRDYRVQFRGRFPDSLEPKGYRFNEWFLASQHGSEVSTLYDTPRGVDPDRWTAFLRVLDSRDPHKVMDYLSSSAHKEFPLHVISQMMAGWRDRHGHVYQARPSNSGLLLQTFTLTDEEQKFKRTGPTRKAEPSSSSPMVFSFE